MPRSRRTAFKLPRDPRRPALHRLVGSLFGLLEVLPSNAVSAAFRREKIKQASSLRYRCTVIYRLKMLPYLTAFIAVICYAAVGPVIKKAGLELPTFLVIGISSTMLAIGAFAILFFSQGKAGFIVPSRSDFFGFLAFTCLSLVGWALYMYSINLIPVAQYDMIAGFGILLTAGFAALLLKEPIHFRYLPAAFFILVGLLIAIGPDLRAK